jgi:hypothetical protein
MDDPDKTFDERVNEVRERRQRDRAGGDLSELSALAGPGRPVVGGGTDLGHPDFRKGDTDDEIEQLRRDISRLAGKVDALLAALDIDDEENKLLDALGAAFGDKICGVNRCTTEPVCTRNGRYLVRTTIHGGHSLGTRSKSAFASKVRSHRSYLELYCSFHIHS